MTRDTPEAFDRCRYYLITYSCAASAKSIWCAGHARQPWLRHGEEIPRPTRRRGLQKIGTKFTMSS